MRCGGGGSRERERRGDGRERESLYWDAHANVWKPAVDCSPPSILRQVPSLELAFSACPAGQLALQVPVSSSCTGTAGRMLGCVCGL